MKEKRSEIKSGAFLSYVYIFVSFAVTFLYTPFLIKYLGNSEYGVYSLAIAILGYMEMLGAGMFSTYVKFASKTKSEEELAKLNGLIFKIYMAFAAMAIIFGIVLSVRLEAIFIELNSIEISKLKVLLYMMLGNVVLTSINGIFESNIIYNENFNFQKSINIVKKILLPLISIPLLIIGYKIYVVGIITILANLIVLLSNVCYCFKKNSMKISFKKYEGKILKTILGFYVFVFLSILIDQINWSIDSVIIGRLRGTFEVTIYAAASSINSVFLLFATGISSVFITRIHKTKSDDNKTYLDMVTKVGRIQFVLLLLMLTGFIFFGQRFIELWLGQEYLDAYIIALLLTCPLVFIVVKSVLTEIYRAKNKHVARTIIYLIMAVLNAIISYFLCMKYGAIGSAVGTTISLVIGNLFIMNIYDHKVVGINMFKFWKSLLAMLKGIILPIIFGLVCMKFISFDNLIVYGGSILAYTGIYLLSFWFLSLNTNEKETVFSVLRKIPVIRKVIK